MGKVLTNLIGQKLGLLTVIGKAENDKWGHTQWSCSCDCGGAKIVTSGDIGSRIKSCGCLSRRTGKDHHAWRGGKIEVRCASPKCNKILLRHKSYRMLYKDSFCNSKCMASVHLAGKNGELSSVFVKKVNVPCAYCGAIIEMTPNKKQLYGNHFCKGGKCFSAWCSENRNGSSNSNYHGGTPEMRIIRKRIAAAMRKAIRQEKAGRTWESLVEYSMADLIDRLKETVPDGYSWENDFINGKGILHIDHKKPMSSFRFETAEDDNFKQCFALENLQLLPAIENMKKSAKLNYQAI